MLTQHTQRDLRRSGPGPSAIRAAPGVKTRARPGGYLSKGKGPEPMLIAMTPAPRRTVPPHTNCSIKTINRIITSTAMTRLMVLFIPPPLSSSTAFTITEGPESLTH
jgi:hypothetical protein